MIPRKLTLSNFLSYGDKPQTIDFTTYSLMCLSGKNGHGKSALLDAITWALWGQARKISGTIKPDAGLVRLGSTRMMVSFEFTFNGREYRVRREYAKTHGKPLATLDFEVQQEDGSYVSLTDKTIRATQAKIEELMGLDFDTFVNSAFLRQGQSNEFSKKSAKERKTILATILGLGRYDALQQKALEKAREFSSEKKILLSHQEQATLQLEQQTTVISALKEKTSYAKTIDKQLQELMKHQQQLDKRDAELKSEREAFEQLKKDAQVCADKQNKLRTLLREIVAQWRKIHRQSLFTPDIRHLEKQRSELLQQEVELRGLQQKSLQIQQDILKKQNEHEKRKALVSGQLEKRLYEGKVRFEKVQLAVAQEQRVLKEKQAMLVQVSQQLVQQDTEHKKLKEVVLNVSSSQKKHEAVKKQFEKRKAYYQKYCSIGSLLNTQLNDLSLRNSMLADVEGAACPTCEQMLTVKRRSFLKNKFDGQRAVLVSRRHRYATITMRLKELLHQQHKELCALEKQKDEFIGGAVKADEVAKNAAQLRGSIDELKKELDKRTATAKQLQETVETEKKKMEQEQKIDVSKDEELSSIAARIAILQDGQKALKYDTEKHKLLLKDIEKIDKTLRELEEFKRELAKQPERRTEMRHYLQSLRDLQGSSRELEKKIKKFESLSEREKEVARQTSEHAALMREERANKEAVLQEIGRLQNQCVHLEKVATEHKQRAKTLKEIDVEIDHYQELGKAFGKNGVQALLIEQAIPEIENEANELLAKLTDNQSQVFIESLRDLKKGGVRETLDIQIADAAGIRPYEMFSGGEGFRIDFALRIAISKLLARRAGTALQTLIIDEGFGSQDEEGLNRLMDAIYAIQNDFSKIIVVSHLDVFKENFPVHLVVEKKSTGTQVTVQERG